ncbi:MAG: hypothetical protein ABJB55_07590 [Actinomycetota bacterium]
MPMDERMRGFQNRQSDTHVRDTEHVSDGAPRRIGGCGLTIAILGIALAVLVLFLLFAR